MKINFSQQIIRKFQLIMEKHHGEYLTSRKKDIKLKEDKRNITKLHLSRACVWLVKTREYLEDSFDCNLDVMQEGEKWVKRCKSLGYNSLEIVNNVKSWLSENHSADNEENGNGKSGEASF